MDINENRCCLCGEDSDGALACLGCWDTAVSFGLIQSSQEVEEELKSVAVEKEEGKNDE